MQHYLCSKLTTAMAKGDKARERLEWQVLNQKGLTEDQLLVIRKLVQPRDLHINGVGNIRTMEAILQGRRTNANVLHTAIKFARLKLAAINKGMDEIETFLSSELTTSD